MQKIKNAYERTQTERFVEIVFTLVSIYYLSSVFWEKERNVNGYYQNLLIISFSVAITIYHTSYEISEHISPWYIVWGYRLGQVLLVLCCAVPFCLLSSTNQNDIISKHINKNCYWQACLFTFIPITYVFFWGYIYPWIGDMFYAGWKIRYADRNE